MTKPAKPSTPEHAAPPPDPLAAAATARQIIAQALPDIARRLRDLALGGSVPAIALCLRVSDPTLSPVDAITQALAHADPDTLAELDLLLADR
jgi:hypothetical protein